jgi:hypothetical protein
MDNLSWKHMPAVLIIHNWFKKDARNCHTNITTKRKPLQVGSTYSTICPGSLWAEKIF